MKRGGWAHFEGAKGLGRIKHACLHRGEGLSRRRDKDTPDLFEFYDDEGTLKHDENKAHKITKPKLLSGGNPQIAKGYGNAPVQAYIAAIPGWKRNIGRRIDAIITRMVPGVKKAVKWNSPFYGLEEGIWFASFHCFTNYVKVTFFRGTALSPVPPGKSKHEEVRYYDIHEGEFDEAQFEDWIRQAIKLPGEKM